VSLPAPGPHPGAADEPLITALVAEHCPACGARLAPAAQWCGLCFADLRPAPGPAGSATAATAPVIDALPSPRAATPQAAAVPSAVPAAAPGTGTAVEAVLPDAAVAGGSGSTAAGTTARPTWPCSGCGASVDVDLDACSICGTGFLGALRSSTGGIELPVVGNLGRFSDRSRIVLGASAGLAIALIMVILTALVGH
jgi:hypothetical protein